MLPPLPPVLLRLSEQDIRDLVGPAAFDRGASYYRMARAAALTWDDEERLLTATVRGSRGASYRTEVYLHEPRHPSVVDFSECSCPVGEDCKHVAALLLTGRARVARAVQQGRGAPAIGASAPPPAWKLRLGELRRTAEHHAAPLAGQETTVLALQFRVEGETPSARQLGARLGLSVRPVKRNAKGAWGSGHDLAWEVLGDDHLYGSHGDPKVRRWFAELAALRVNDRRYYYGSSAWTDVGRFVPRLFVPHLAHGADLGVPFVGTAARDRVTLARTASVELAATRGDRGLSVRPRVVVDGVEHDPAMVGAAGEGGVFTLAPSTPSSPGRAIVVAPTPDLLPESADLLTLGEVTIPPDDVAEFLADYYPVLRRHVAVTSPDASVELPEPARPRLAVVARLDPTGGTLAWRWEYQVAGDDAVIVRPFRAARGDVALRNLDEEQRIMADVEAAVRALPAFGAFRLDDADGSGRSELGPHAALDAATHLLPLLRERDDVVVTADEPPFTELDQPPTIAVRATDTEDNDWFDLDVTVTVAGREIPFRPLFAALAGGDDRLLLPDGAWMRLDVPALDTLRGLIGEAARLSDKPGRLRLSRHQASLWGELEDVADIVEQSEAWQSAVGGLRVLMADDAAAAAALHTPVPASVHATLRDYQEQGLSWLAFCHDHGLGGILADDMGLGKTLQTLALLAHARERGGPPFLVVAPASVVGNWAAEAARFVPHLRVAVLDTTLARAGVDLPALAAGADVVVTSYAIFRLDFEAFQAADWSGLVLDEAQFVKNPAAKANECARRLRAPFKLAITGTPMENNLTELWALLAVVAPGLFPSQTRFREDYVRPIEAASRAGADDDVKAVGGAALARLRRRVRPVLLRRTKEQVAPELPPRQEQELRVDLSPRHRKVYDTHLQRERSRVLGMLADFDANRMAIFRSLTTLRRMALDASLVDPERYAGVPSSKLDALFEQLDEVIAEGHRALVFSQFTSYLGLVAQRCAARGVDYAYLDGSTRRRADVVRGFRDGDAPLFLISLKAGGFGLNLTEAGYVFLLDPWWNPAVEAQAVDRTHRIGQTRNVMVFRMVAAGTIEEKVMALKERKARLTGAVLGDDEELFSRALDASDIRELFEQ